MTPQASKLLSQALPEASEKEALPDNVKDWLRQCFESRISFDSRTFQIQTGRSTSALELSVVRYAGPDEILLRLSDTNPGNDQELLHKQLSLTLRELEVLLWIARGKSNKDIAEILQLSPRTVNKHLEQIFNKLGVENRTSAAALAVHTLKSG